jgi:hypothetical protein
VTEQGRYFLDKAEIDGGSASNTLSQSITFASAQSLQGYIEIRFAENEPFVQTVLKGGEKGSGLAKAGGTEFTVEETLPREYSLSQNFPNPFNPITQISYALPQAGEVRLNVFNMNGQQVADLVNGYKTAGRYQAIFNGAQLSSGVYFYRLEAGSFTAVKRMLLVK